MIIFDCLILLLVPSAHKLFAKAQTKTNRGLIINALTYSVFPGVVNGATRNKVRDMVFEIMKIQL